MAYTNGIDVSRYDGDIDWRQVVNAGNRFAVLRATVGDYYTDPRFYSYWTGAKAAGLLVTVYHVVVANRYADKQIERLFSVMNGRKTDFPIVLDIERDDGVSNAANTACIQDCIQQMNKTDTRRPIIYTAHYYWKDHVIASPDWAKYDLWVASYKATSPFLPPDWASWKFWQYSDTGKTPGITSATDMNYFNGSYEDLVNYAGQVPVTPPPVNPVTGLRAKVLVSVLNIRSGASTSFKLVGTLLKDKVVQAINLGGKDLWIQFETGKWAASSTGGATFMEILPGATVNDGLQARVLVDHLNIRSGSAASYPDIGRLDTGAVIKVLAIGGKDAWIQHDLGKWSAFAIGTQKYMEVVA